jgi:hypothetical protein
MGHEESGRPGDHTAKSAGDDPHADHIAGKHHHKYDPACDDCRCEAEEEYKRKLASGELNRIEFMD